MNTTVRMKVSQIYKDWHVIDAAGRPLGRVATEAATLLRGKHKPTYEPHLDDGDFVIIVNAAQVRVTGRKSEQIKYHTHSGYPGGLKTRSYADQLAKFPERVLERAVWGMLPGGSLGEAIFRHLKVYRGINHPHQSQITGSERARATREALAAETVLATKKPARLRPLTGAAPGPQAPGAAEDATTAALQTVQDEAVLSSETPAAPAPVTIGGQTTIPYGTPTPAEAAITAGAALSTEAPKRRSSGRGAAAAAPPAPAETELAPKRRATASRAPAGAAAAAAAKPKPAPSAAKAAPKAAKAAPKAAKAAAAPAKAKAAKAEAAPAKVEAPPKAKPTATKKTAPGASGAAKAEESKPARRRPAAKREE
ncbi:MAG: 50S ribosomal protein L13 [Tepidiformaceae bacterium]